MSILIKGMEMPNSCSNCELCGCYIESKGEIYRCDVSMYPIKYLEKRLDNCPLVELPPHGRLIDADELEDKCHRLSQNEWNKSTGTTWAYAYATFESDVEDAPTIIEAEEGE